MAGPAPGSVLLPESIARIEARDGAEHAITSFEPGNTALLVIDMQNFYMVEGNPSFCAPALPLVPIINRLATASRRAGVEVIWLRNVTNPEVFKTWSNFYGRLKPDRLEDRKANLAQDSEGFRIWPELDVRDEDLTLNKTRYSAFIEDASNIRTVLAERAIDTLILCGIVTNVCVESTARDAMMLNYRVLIAEDACASGSAAGHSAALNTFYTNFGDVQMTDQIIDNLGGKAAAAAE